MDEYDITITTRYNREEIRQQVASGLWKMPETIWKLSDEQVRKALVDLGWTPPKEG